ncbi:MAG: 50S ribosomal protein L13 [Candidatus Marsarchaeota archaeon]|nr:50S ribosomal protein L13 [Candidatus Marsarchaeota archaeon]
MRDIKPSEYLVIDADRKVVGRVASVTAKSLLQGKKVAVINAEKAVISGSKNDIVKRYTTRVNLKEKANPEHSAYWPRRPDMLVKRIIRGMIPYRKPHGKDAYRRLLVFVGVPKAFEGAKIEELKVKDVRGMFVNTMTVKELSELLGYKRAND